MTQITADAKVNSDPEGSIFLSKNNVGPTPDVDTLVEQFFGPDWEQAESVLDDIEAYYPEYATKIMHRLRTCLLMQRGGPEKIISEEGMLAEILVREYLNEIITQRLRELGSVATRSAILRRH